jgi:predicted alpha/beta superfamily hydrolase
MAGRETSIPNTDYFELQSAHVGDTFGVWVTRPVEYDTQPGVSYPVLYLLDGNLTSLVLAPYVEWRSYDLIDATTPFIAVSIGYLGTTTQTWLTKRTRDLVPNGEPLSAAALRSLRTHPAFASWTKEERDDYHASVGGGHADRFLACLEQELMPAIEQRYPVDRGRAGLWGYSSGGLFALYTAFEQAGGFAAIGAGSPAVLTQDSTIFGLEEQARASGGVTPVSLHLTLNASELTGPDSGCRDFAIQFARLVDLLHRDDLDGLRFSATILTGESHATGWTQSFLSFVRAFLSTGNHTTGSEHE